MLDKSKLALVATLLAASIAPPAFAQAYDANMQPSHYDGAGKHVWGAWAPQAPAGDRHVVMRRGGLYAYAPGRVRPEPSGSGHDPTIGTER
jgi:hypothetical protein